MITSHKEVIELFQKENAFIIESAATKAARIFYVKRTGNSIEVCDDTRKTIGFIYLKKDSMSIDSVLSNSTYEIKIIKWLINCVNSGKNIFDFIKLKLL